jgi:hypothetical protein
MYGQAMAYFKFQVYLYGSEAIPFEALLWVIQSQHYESSDCPRPPLQHYRKPSPLFMAPA